jgi:Ca2+-binding RTX toxin-like protein
MATIFGGDGDDTLNGTNQADTISGLAGNDIISASDGADLVDGGSGNDLLDGGTGDDTLLGGLGDDTLLAGFGSDSFSGGDGIDTYQIAGTAVDAFAFDINLQTGTDTYGNTYSGIEVVLGGSQNDTVLGNDTVDERLDGGGGNDSLSGGGGNDTLLGGSGNDTLIGGAGDDWLRGNAGTDLLDGGDGNDQIVIDGFDVAFGGAGDDTIFLDPDVIGINDNMTVSGGETGETTGDVLDLSASLGTLRVTYGTNGESGTVNGIDTDAEADLTFIEIERVIATDQNDTIDGTVATGGINVETRGGDDLVFGGNGNDTIDAGAGNDLVWGGAGDDILIGGQGDDLLSGEAGDDLLIGGEGADLLIGGAGDDLLVGGAGDAIDAGAGDDTIRFDPLLPGNSVITVIGGETDEDEGGDALSLDGLTDFTITWTGGDKSSESGTLTYLNSSGQTVTVNFTEIERVICFARGTLIGTERGEVPVQDLRLGDRVLTADHGLQPVRWLAVRRLSAADLASAPHLRPIRIRAGALGPDLPRRDLTVSPQHRILVRSRVAERMFHSPEVLVAARQLLDLDGVEVVDDGRGVDYWHFMCDRHEVVMAEGLEAETLFTGPEALKALPRECRRELFELFPELHDARATVWTAARPLPKGSACRRMVARHIRNGKPLVAAISPRLQGVY